MNQFRTGQIVRAVKDTLDGKPEPDIIEGNLYQVTNVRLAHGRIIWMTVRELGGNDLLRLDMGRPFRFGASYFESLSR